MPLLHVACSAIAAYRGSRYRFVSGIAIVSVLLWLRRYPPPQPNAVRLSLGLPQGVTLQRNWHPFEQMAVSPDGEMLAFSATDASGQSSLWIRPLRSAEARKMDQTEGALLPFWSPDSQFVGFWAGGKLKKIRRTGGLPEVICSVPEIAQGAWGTDGTILFAKAVNSPIFRVNQDGANATPATSLLPGQVSQMWVQFLPDGRHFIYLARTSLTTDDPQAKVYAQSLDGGAPIELLTSQSRAIAVPDYLLFAQRQNLFAQRMDWKATAKDRRTVVAGPQRGCFSSLPWHFRIHCLAKRRPYLRHSRGIIFRPAEVVRTRWLQDRQSRSGYRLSAVHAFSGWDAFGAELVPSACHRKPLAHRYSEQYDDSPDERSACTIRSRLVARLALCCL